MGGEEGLILSVRDDDSSRYRDRYIRTKDRRNVLPTYPHLFNNLSVTNIQGIFSF